MSTPFLRRCVLLWLVAASTAITAGAPEKTFDLAISRGALPAEQRLLRTEKGDAVRLRFTSNAPGEIHFHAYRLSTAITPAAPAELKFTAHATGRFRIEWHPAAGTDKKSDHHGAPLAILEVRPK